MREAMYLAELGDDVLGEDPTVNRLQQMAADRMGKEAALFVASGTMGNLIAALTHCGRGDGAIMGEQSHTYLNEGGGVSVWGGVYMLPLPNRADGTLDPAAIESAIPTQDVHHPRVNLVCLENTHNYCGGVALSPEYTQTVADVARRNHLALHLDGARIFNAALALGLEPRELSAPADSVMFCLSKGLSCPVGSMLCGSAEFISQARRARKMLGGGMRQAGVLAAAGVVALQEMIERMQEDHDNARLLAEGIAETPGLSVNLDTVQTNIVFFDCVTERKTADQFVAALREQGVLMMVLGGGRVRAVTHYGIERADIEQALTVMRQVMAS
jgi:threonine aldolase